MNQIRREDPNAKLVQDIRAVVERQGWPDFISGFEVKLGEWEDIPVAWITYKLVKREPLTSSSLDDQVTQTTELTKAVDRELNRIEDGRLTFYRFADPVA